MLGPVYKMQLCVGQPGPNFCRMMLAERKSYRVNGHPVLSDIVECFSKQLFSNNVVDCLTTTTNQGADVNHVSEPGPATSRDYSECMESLYSLSKRHQPIQCGATAERRTRDREVPGSRLACAICFYLQARKVKARIYRHCFVAQFAGNAHWAESSPLFAHRARHTPLKCKNEYLVLALRRKL